jgi:hypothetical protein
MAFLNGRQGILATLVRGSTAAENGTDGIFLRDGGVASGNSLLSNSGAGITVRWGTVTGNAFFNNLPGINATCPAVIAGNTLVHTTTGNQASQIVTNGGCTVVDNDI